MKGQILDVSIQGNSGIISGDDGNRYSFSGPAWNVPGVPRRGMRVDFDPDGSTAAGIYADTSTAPAPAAIPARAAGIPAVATPVVGPSAGPGAVPSNSSSGMGVFGMALGLASLILFWVPILGWLLMVVGMGLSVTGLVMSKKRGGHTGFSTAGVILNSVTLSIRTFVAVVATITSALVSKVISQIFDELGLGPLMDLLSFF